MAERENLEAEFLAGWTALTLPEADDSPRGTRRSISSRLAGESEERREKRLKQARECSARRRSSETQEQRERRLKDQRERMAQKRRMETAEVREERYTQIVIIIYAPRQQQGPGEGLDRIQIIIIV